MTYRETQDELEWRASLDRPLQTLFPVSNINLRGTSAATEGECKIDAAIVDLGLHSLLIPQQAGGVGATIAEASAAFTALGRVLLGHRLVEQALASLILTNLPDGAGQTLLQQMNLNEKKIVTAVDPASWALGRDAPVVFRKTAERTYELSGEVPRIRSAMDADVVLVPAHSVDSGEAGLFALNASDDTLELSPCSLIDDVTGADILFRGVSASGSDVLAVGEIAQTALARSLRGMSIMTAAELGGLVEGALEITVTHVQTRQQFGGPLSQLQSVVHNLAEMYADLQIIRSTVREGIASAAIEADNDSRLPHAILAQALTSARSATEKAIQLHGAMGVTHECPAGHYYLRVLSLSAHWGCQTEHHERLAVQWLEKLAG